MHLKVRRKAGFVYVSPFPTKYWNEQLFPSGYEQQFIIAPLVATLRVCGLSIHDVVNSRRVKNLLKMIWKSRNEMILDYLEAEIKAEAEYRAWCQELGCLV